MRSTAWLAAILVVAVACGDPSTTTQTVGSDDGPEADGAAPLEATLESWDVVIDELPIEWEQTSRWIVEGADAAWDTGCPAFDRLAEIYLLDVPTITVWESEGIEATHRVASREQYAPAYLETVRSLVSECSPFEVDGVLVEVRPLAPGVIATEPVSDWAAVELSAYPVPDEATAGTTPDFDSSRSGYLIVLARHNVVSQLIVGVDAEGGTELIDGLVAAADEALRSAPAEGVAPPAAPAVGSPPAPQRVELSIDRENCRNGGGFDVDGRSYALIGPVPQAWRSIDPVVGDAVFDDESAEFTGPDGERVVLTTAAVPAECVSWGEERPTPPPERIGRLDCPGVGLDETRVPDSGQTPEDLASAFGDEVVTVEAGEPLQWWGLDADGAVVLGIFLGDVEGADFQIFRCRAG